MVAVVKPLLNNDLVRQHGVVFKFNVIGDGGGIFYLDLRNGKKYMYSQSRRSDLDRFLRKIFKQHPIHTEKKQKRQKGGKHLLSRFFLAKI